MSREGDNKNVSRRDVDLILAQGIKGLVVGQMEYRMLDRGKDVLERR